MKKPFYKNIKIVLGKKLSKNTKYSRIGMIWKIGHLAKSVARARATDFAKWSDSVKN